MDLGKKTTDMKWLVPLCRWENQSSRWFNKSVKFIQFKNIVFSTFWVNSSKYFHRKHEIKGLSQTMRGVWLYGERPLEVGWWFSRNYLYSWVSPGSRKGTISRCFTLKLKTIPRRTSVQSCVDFRFYQFLWAVLFMFWFCLSMQTTFTQAVDHLLHSVFIWISFAFITRLGETIILLKWFVCFYNILTA